MKYLFIVQGEGRGHLTQAVALSEMLIKNNHEVVGALVGSKAGLYVPSFFTDMFQYPSFSFASPCLVYNKKTKALDLFKTLTNSLLNTSKYISSMIKIDDLIHQLQPDIIINFYDILAGIHQFFFRPKIPMVCIAHQYLLLNPQFVHPSKKWLDKFLVNSNTRMTALGASKKLALSFSPFSHCTHKNIYTIPPLLRHEITQLHPSKEDYILVYMTQASLKKDLIIWHAKNPNINVHCFTDQDSDAEICEHGDNLVFHQIDGPKFFNMMRTCKGLVTTAGFESVCEAMYLGKPMKIIPVPKHYEQACNASDALRVGAGITGTSFDLTDFLDSIPKYQNISSDFQEWCGRSSLAFFGQIESVLSKQTKPNPIFSNSLH